jgi:hypothetical protein
MKEYRLVQFKKYHAFFYRIEVFVPSINFWLFKTKPKWRLHTEFEDYGYGGVWVASIFDSESEARNKLAGLCREQAPSTDETVIETSLALLNRLENKS